MSHVQVSRSQKVSGDMDAKLALKGGSWPEAAALSVTFNNGLSKRLSRGLLFCELGELGQTRPQLDIV